jgi:hypothetical protein
VDTFVLKFVMTPTLIALISLAGRRWGPAISGVLVGLPLTSGPIAFFLAVDHGVSFAAATAMGTLAGTISQAAFCVAYKRSAFRFGWALTVLLSSLVFAIFTVVLQSVKLSLPPLCLLVVLSLILALRLTMTVHIPAAAKRLPKWDIPTRMFIATAYVILLTGIAPRIGPHLTGLLSPFPLYAAVDARGTELVRTFQRALTDEMRRPISRRDAVRSQVIDVLEAQEIKETGNEEG